MPYSGYLHFVPRIVTDVSLLAGMSLTPLLMDVSSLVISAFCISYLSLERFRILIRNDWLRCFLCVLIVSIPIMEGEVFLNITNIQWFMVLYLTLWTMDQWLNFDAIRARNRKCSLLESAIATISQLTTVYGFLLIPLLISVTLKRSRAERFQSANTALLTIPVIGACIQGAIFFATEFGYGLGAIHPLPNPPQTMRIIQLISSTITKLVYADTGKLFYTLGFLPMYLIAATGVVLFVCFLLQIRECRKISVLLLFLIGCSLMATSIFRGEYAGNPNVFLNEGDRYIFYPIALMLIALLTNIQYLKRKGARISGLVLLVLVVVNFAAHFAIASPPDYKFQSYAQYYDPNGKTLIYAPNPPWAGVQDSDNWFTPIPASPAGIASQIAQLKPTQIGGVVVVNLALSYPNGTLLNVMCSVISVSKTNTVFVFLRGWVIGINDPMNAFLVVDGSQAFPTAFGIDWMSYWTEAPPNGWDRSGWMGTITTSGLSVGMHEVSIWIVAANGIYYPPNIFLILNISE